MVQGRESASLVLWRIMRAEGCDRWRRNADGSVLISYYDRASGQRYARVVSTAELADTVANRVAGDGYVGE